MNNANKKIALISDYFNLYLITLFIIFIKPQLFSDYPKIDISKINKLDKPTIHVANPTQTTAEQLKPQFKDVVLKAVKAVNSSLTESDFDYFIESKGEDWPINITNDKTVSVQIKGKNNATCQTSPIDVKIKNS